MKACILFTAAIASSVCAAVVPSIPQVGAALPRRAVSVDMTCSGSAGFTCPTNKCCSRWGFCGDSDLHCDAGCQPSFGTCANGSPTDDTTSPCRNSAPSGITIPRTKPGHIPYGAIITSCNRPGLVALTFDDGPSIYTGRLLDLLKSKGVVATFFLNGKNWGGAITEPTKVALMQRMLSEGHQIGSHTWSHADLSTLNEEDMVSQMTLLESAFLTAIGKFPIYMRSPYLSCNAQCLQTMDCLGYHVVHTNLDTADWQKSMPNSKEIVEAAVAASDPASKSFIPLAHDVYEATVTELAEYMIDSFKAKRYALATIGQCLDDDPTYWYRTTQ